MRITFTGHRPDKIKDIAALKGSLKDTLKKLLSESEGPFEFIVGGAPGFDTIALETLLEMNIAKSKIILAVPFRGFEKFAGYNHAQENQRVHQYNYTIGIKVLEVGGKDGTYAQKCHKRNEYLVNNADVIISFWDGSLGGTANTLKLAKKKGIRIIPLLK